MVYKRIAQYRGWEPTSEVRPHLAIIETENLLIRDFKLFTGFITHRLSKILKKLKPSKKKVSLAIT